MICVGVVEVVVVVDVAIDDLRPQKKKSQGLWSGVDLAGQSLPFMGFLLMKRFQKKRWIEQYGEYPISVKRSRSDFRAKCWFGDLHSN